jgi:hypothetical protein
VIEKKYLDMFERLTREPAPGPIEPLPGLVARRRRDVPPAAAVVQALKAGPVVH